MAGTLGTVAITAGVGTNIRVIVDSGGYDHQLGVIEYVDGSLNPVQVSAATPLPITGAVTGAFYQATQPVSGTFYQATQPISASALPLPTGAATDTLQLAGNTNLAAIAGKDFATQTTLAAMSGKLPATLGTKTSAASLSVVIASDQASIPVTASVSVGSSTLWTTASKTRPADTTAYAVNDVVAESTSAATVWTFTGAVASNGGAGMVFEATCTDSTKASGTLPIFNLWLFSVSPTTQNDNAAFNPSTSDLANFVGVVPIDRPFYGTATGVVVGSAPNVAIKCGASSTTLYGILVAGSAFTPSSGEAFGITLKIGQG